jgi:hypothetical protein
MSSHDLAPGVIAVIIDAPAIARSWVDGPGGEKTTIVDTTIPYGEMVLVLKNFEVENDYVEVWWPGKQRWVILGKWTMIPLDDIQVEKK